MRHSSYNPNQGFLFAQPAGKAAPVSKGTFGQATPEQRPIWEVWHGLGPQIKAQAERLGLAIDEVESPADFGSIFYLRHPLLAPRKIEARPYLMNLVEKVDDRNSIVVLPTGLGKTMLVEVITAMSLERQPGKKALILAPTKPICDQHVQTLRESLPNCRSELIIGPVSGKQRNRRWQNGQIIVATAETILAELENGTGVGSPAALALVCFDEIHHLTGKHAYCQLAGRYLGRPEIQKLGLTGSLPVKFVNIEQIGKSIDCPIGQVLAKDRFSPEIVQFTYHRFIKPVFIERPVSPAYAAFKDLLLEELRKAINDLYHP